MYVMQFIVWLLPILFMIHDFEEIMMAEIWSKRYNKEIAAAWPGRKPFGLNYIKHFQTPTFSIGVEIEFLLFSLISFFSVILNSYFIWFSVFLGFILHLIFIHIPICIKFKHYVPGITTSVIVLLPCFWLLYSAQKILRYSAGFILSGTFLGIILLILLIPILHKSMESWSKRLYNYSKS